MRACGRKGEQANATVISGGRLNNSTNHKKKVQMGLEDEEREQGQGYGGS